MTYNFDPERWYENEVAVLRSKYQAGEIDRRELRLREAELEARLDEIWRRLDPSYQVNRS
jgi:hypothetical protein